MSTKEYIIAIKKMLDELGEKDKKFVVQFFTIIKLHLKKRGD